MAASFSFLSISLYRLDFSFFSFRGVRGVLGCSSIFDLCRNLAVSTKGAGAVLFALLLFSFSYDVTETKIKISEIARML